MRHNDRLRALQAIHAGIEHCRQAIARQEQRIRELELQRGQLMRGDPVGL